LGINRQQTSVLQGWAQLPDGTENADERIAMTQSQNTGRGAREYDVLLRLCLADAIADDALATLAEHILEAVESYATSCVDGAAIGYTLEPPQILLDFTTEAENLAGVDAVIARVNEIICGETSMKFELEKLCGAVPA